MVNYSAGMFGDEVRKALKIRQSRLLFLNFNFYSNFQEDISKSLLFSKLLFQSF